MPYITSQDVKERRQAIKKALPNFKISVTRENASTIRIVFREGAIDMVKNKERGYDQVNQYYIEKYYEGAAKEALETAYNIAESGQKIIDPDSDYGAIPNFYVTLNIGEFDRPYIVKK